ncbi:MAG: hypothetical protein ACRC5A_12375 [Enterobacteriaceae bacterium]
MTELTEFLPGLRERVPGCPEPVMLNALRQAAIRFCERTLLWRGGDRFELAGDCEFVCVPANAHLVRIESATLDGETLIPVSLHSLDRHLPGWPEMKGKGLYITQLVPDSVRVVPACEGCLTLRLILKPSEDAEVLPDFLFTAYRQTLIDGALGELLLLPKQPFTSAEQAMFFSSRFNQTVAELFVQYLRGQQNAPLHSTAHYF